LLLIEVFVVQFFFFCSVVNISLLIGINPPFNALTLLVAQQEGHQACKMFGDGMFVVMI